MSIKRNKRVIIKCAISSAQINEIVEELCKRLSGNIEDIDRIHEFYIGDIRVFMSINIHDSKIHTLTIGIFDKDNQMIELECNIVLFYVQQHINEYNKSIEQEKQIREDIEW